MKLAICLPCQDMCHSAFAYDLARLASYWASRHRNDELAIYRHTGTLIADQRETLARTALIANADRILFIDSDMRFPKNGIDRLEAHGVPIVGSNYSTRRHPLHGTTWKMTDAEDRFYTINTELKDNGLEQVDAMGFGFILIHADVFKVLPQPWFHISYNSSKKTYGGEDMWFCASAGKNKFPIFVDHTLSKEVRHVGSYEYGFEDAQVAEIRKMG